jgi:hypothetical protein
LFATGTSTITIDHSIITGNKTSPFGGGGIYNYSGLMHIYGGSIISKNSAELAGGIFNLNKGSLYLNDATVTGNKGVNSGGGIRSSGYLRADHSVITKNSGGNYGGGVANYGTFLLYTTNVTGNKARLKGGGIYNHLSNSTFTGQVNGYVYGNKAKIGPDVYGP